MARSVMAWGTALTAVVLAAGCASQDGGSGGGSASCALVLTYQGRTYLAERPAARVQPGRPLGEARFAVCDDTGGQVDDDPALAEDAAARFPAYAVPGVDPADAFVVGSGPYREYLFVAGPGGGAAVPPEVARLLSRR